MGYQTGDHEMDHGDGGGDTRDGVSAGVLGVT